MTIKKDRDLILSTKLFIPEPIWRMMTKPASAILRMVPEKLKYSFGMSNRQKRLPYSCIQSGDVVIQIGAPRDLLSVGRSRSAYFMNIVSGSGKLVVMEPDKENCKALQEYAERNGLTDKVIIVNEGGWSEETTLSFYESKEHPASAVLSELSEASPEMMRRKGYTEIKIPVTTVDAVLKKHNLPTPKLVSITTNGAEIQIMDGMKKAIADGLPYISLAITGDRYQAQMETFGYDYIADDDRGYTFEKLKR